MEEKINICLFFHHVGKRQNFLGLHCLSVSGLFSSHCLSVVAWLGTGAGQWLAGKGEGE